MKRSIFILISLSTFLFSCAIPEENFSYRYAQIWCKKWKSCDKDEFNEVWEEGIAQCEEDSEYLIETFLNLGYALGEPTMQTVQEPVSRTSNVQPVLSSVTCLVAPHHAMML